MTIVKLYTGGGVSYSPEYAEGRTESDYVRLVADDGMMLTDGERTALCLDVPVTEVERWSETKYEEPEDEEATEADYESALSRLGVEV